MKKLISFFVLFMSLAILIWQQPVQAAEPKVGVYFSETSKWYAKIDREGGKWNGKTIDRKNTYSSAHDKALKTYHLFEQQGYNPTKISEKDLENRAYLQQFDTVLFPYSVQMTHNQRQAIKEYIRDGGGAVFMFTAARNDADNLPYQANQLDLSPLIYRTDTWIWEWDNLTEVFRAGFVNDVVMKQSTITGLGNHSIVKDAEREIGRKLTIRNTSSSGEWTEIIKPYNGYAVPLLGYSSFQSSSPKHTPANVPVSYATEYGLGRAVFIGFKIYDHFGVTATADWEDHTKGLAFDGRTGDADTKAFLKHSVLWTAKDVAKPQNLLYDVNMQFKDLRAYQRASDYSVYGTVRVDNAGDTPIRGTIIIEVKDGAGKVLRSYERYKPGYTPKGQLSGPELRDESYLEEKFHFQLPKTLAHGNYTVSVRFKEGLKGAGYSIKSTAKTMIVGKGQAQFRDVLNFPDVSTKDEVYGAIRNLTNLGVIRGYPTGRFGPENQVTRAQAAEMILKATNTPVRTGLSLQATDLRPGQYGYDIVATAVNKGILTVNGGKVRAADAMTRAEVANALVKGFNFEATPSKSFSDVPKNSPYLNEIGILYQVNVTKGFGDNTFEPNRTLSRKHFSSFVNRSLTAVQK